MKGMNFSWYIYVVVCISTYIHACVVDVLSMVFWRANKKSCRFHIIIVNDISAYDAILLLWNFSMLKFHHVFFFVCMYDIIIHRCRDKLKDLTFHEQHLRHVSTNSVFSHKYKFYFHDETKISNWNLIHYFHISLM